MAGPERGPRRAASAPLALASLLLAGCAAARYAPCPVETPSPLPADAFPRCRAVFERHYGPPAIAEPQAFQLQSGWVADPDATVERRASVFLDGGALAVLVEVRWLAEPWLGTPTWSAIKGDAVAERELAEELAAVLREPAAGET